MVSFYVDNYILKDHYKNIMFLWKHFFKVHLKFVWNVLEYEICLPYVMFFNGIILHTKSYRFLTWSIPQPSVN